MPRTRRAERRKNDFKKAIRKKKIAESHNYGDMYDNLHQFSKNKIHCSCPMCNSKTNNRFYGPKFNPSASYKRRIDASDAAIKDLFDLYAEGFQTEEEREDFTEWWYHNLEEDFEKYWDYIWRCYKAERGEEL